MEGHIPLPHLAHVTCTNKKNQPPHFESSVSAPDQLFKTLGHLFKLPKLGLTCNIYIYLKHSYFRALKSFQVIYNVSLGSEIWLFKTKKHELRA